MQVEAGHQIVLALIAAAYRRDPSAYKIVPRLLAQTLAIASHLPEEERHEIAGLLRESASELLLEDQYEAAGTNNVVTLCVTFLYLLAR